MNRYQVCSRCRFWISVRKLGGFAGLGSGKRRANRGQCHRYAPRSQALSPQWPWTKADESCGEFETRPDERRDLDAPEPEASGDADSSRSASNG